MRHPCRRSALARLTAWLRRTDRCATSLEFASLAIPCFMMLLGVMEISYDLYVQAELDNLADTAARSVQVGAATGISNETSSTFTAASICPSVGGLLDCTLITVAVAPIPTGRSRTSGTSLMIQPSHIPRTLAPSAPHAHGATVAVCSLRSVDARDHIVIYRSH